MRKDQINRKRESYPQSQTIVIRTAQVEQVGVQQGNKGKLWETKGLVIFRHL